MPPKRNAERKQPHRTAPPLSLPFVHRRTQRYLDELERVNYHKFGDAADDKERLAVSEAKGGAAVAGGVVGPGGKKSTMRVRQLLLYRKNLATLIDESNIRALPPSTPTYLTAAAPPPAGPPVAFCVACGYWGHYRCQKCGDGFCSRKCGEWHAEFRCGKV